MKNRIKTMMSRGITGLERGDTGIRKISTWSHSLENSLWKRLWTWLPRLGIEWMNEFWNCPLGRVTRYDSLNSECLLLHTGFIHPLCNSKRYSKPITDLERPVGFQEFEAPRFQDNRHMKVVRLSALCTSHLHPQEILLFLLEAESTPGP
jgi:hypothetical protein